MLLSTTDPVTPYPVVLFDGVCNLCIYSVQFIIKRDRTKKIKFASLQWDISRQLIKRHLLSEQIPDTLLLIEDGRIYLNSTAILRISRHLRNPWPLFYILIIIPPFLRDSLYRFIARNRYRWFGRRPTCNTPPQCWEDRFLTDK